MLLLLIVADVQATHCVVQGLQLWAKRHFSTAVTPAAAAAAAAAAEC
jgi:hypothetical protein